LFRRRPLQILLLSKDATIALAKGLKTARSELEKWLANQRENTPKGTEAIL
jgi:hypothetical protein